MARTKFSMTNSRNVFFFKKSKKFKEFTEEEEKYTKINKVVANFSRTLLVA